MPKLRLVLTLSNGAPHKYPGSKIVHKCHHKCTRFHRRQCHVVSAAEAFPLDAESEIPTTHQPFISSYHQVFLSEIYLWKKHLTILSVFITVTIGPVSSISLDNPSTVPRSNLQLGSM